MHEDIHVSHRKNGLWAVISEGSEKAFRLFETQKEALDVARPMAQKYGVELIIHGKDNLIGEKDSYGPDPYPPRG